MNKFEALIFLETERVRLENRKPSKQNKEDISAIEKTLEYLNSNRDQLITKK